MSAGEIPNTEWYERHSLRRGSAAHCPFATVKACPRYYQSLSLLGEAGSTQISEREDQRLFSHWQQSDLWPRTDELATSIMGEPGNPSIFSNFCPEVAAARFGYFVTFLARYSEELDAGFAQQRLAREGAPAGHPNWSWSSYTPQHFTDCPIYSILLHRATVPPPLKVQPWWLKHLMKIVVAVLIALATAIITKLFT